MHKKGYAYSETSPRPQVYHLHGALFVQRKGNIILDRGCSWFGFVSKVHLHRKGLDSERFLCFFL